MIRAARILLAALALALAAAGPAQAHALLEGTAPERGAVAPEAPGQVVLRFSEPVEIAFGAVRVFASDGSEVQQGEPFHPGGRDDQVAVRLRDGVKDGGYTVTYRVVSADSHPVNGGFVFSVGDEAAAPGASVADLLGDQKAGPVTSVAFGVARAVEYGAIALGLGVLAVLVLVWPAARRRRGAARPAPRSGAARRGCCGSPPLAGALAALPALALQAATAEGTSLWSALGGVREVLDTRFGVVWGLGVLAWIVASRPWPSARPAGLRRWPACLALALLPGLGGHAGVQDPVAVLLPANALHVLAAGAWIGGLAVLVAALPAATRALERGRPHARAVGRRRALLRCRADLRRAAAGRRDRPVAARARRRERPLGHAVRARDRDQGRARRRAARARRAQPPPHPAAARSAPRTRAPRRAARACCCGARCAPRSRSASPRSP